MPSTLFSHGGDIYGSAPIRLDFSVNTTPLGIPPAVLQAVSSCREEILHYPDSQCRKLREALAAYWTKFLTLSSSATGSIHPSEIICGNGAADLIFGLVEALKPRRAVLFAPCFSEYEAALRLRGCEMLYIPLYPEENWLPNPERLSEALACVGGADLIFLGNPNNPTGMALTTEELEVFVRICRSYDALLAVDECFNGFLEAPERYTMAGLTGVYENLFVLNAFTKTHGMAGLRLGYAICKDTKLLDKIAAVRQPWSVSGIAQKAGIAALSEENFIRRSREVVRKERPFLTEGLKKLGFTVYPSMVNYILFSTSENAGYDSKDLKDFLTEHQILIRSCANYRGLDSSFYRIAVRTHEENRELLHCMGEWKNSIFSKEISLDKDQN